MQDTNELLTAMLAESPQVSDLIFSPGKPPQVKVNGKLRNIKNAGNSSEDDIVRLTRDLVGTRNELHRLLQDYGDCDFSFSLPGQSRFRVNIFMQRGTCAIVMRVIPPDIPDLRQLQLPLVIEKKVVTLKSGFVLITGPTGSGKSSTLAAIINHINNNELYKYHIVTIEDPIEFMHRHNHSTIHQRELPSDTRSFSQALRSALRQSPDVIVVSELRDRETIEIALKAAETGHLVFSTLHTNDSAKTVERILGFFPIAEQPMIRMRLASSFKWIISQRLIPKKNNSSRVVAVETLCSTERTRGYIAKGEPEGQSLLDAIKKGKEDGMQSFDSDLARLVKEGTISEEDALLYATNANDLDLELRGLTKNFDVQQGDL